MSVPVSQMWTVASYVIRQKLARRKQYPLVLMLEPLFRCNLACAGCGKIQYPAHVLKRQLTPEECFRAVDECGAPGGFDPGRRTAHAPRNRQDCRRPGGAQEVHLPVHQRLTAEGKDPSLQAHQVPDLQRAPGRTEGAPRLRRMPRGRIRDRGGGHPRSPATRLPGHHQHHAF